MENNIISVIESISERILTVSDESKLTLVLTRGKSYKDIIANEFLENLNFNYNVLYYSLNLEKEEVYHANNIKIDDTPDHSIEDIIEKTKECVQKNNVKMVIIDNLLLVSIKQVMSSRQKEIEEILYFLKRLANELNIEIITFGLLSTYPKTKPSETEITTYYGPSALAIIDTCVYLEEIYGKEL